MPPCGSLAQPDSSYVRLPAAIIIISRVKSQQDSHNLGPFYSPVLYGPQLKPMVYCTYELSHVWPGSWSTLFTMTRRPVWVTSRVRQSVRSVRRVWSRKPFHRTDRF